MWQNATQYNMAHSIRISDQLYQSALAASALFDRSLAQQVEHWVRMGRSVEAVESLESAQINLIIQEQLAKDLADIRSGLVDARSFSLFHSIDVKKLGKATFPEVDFDELTNDYE